MWRSAVAKCVWARRVGAGCGSGLGSKAWCEAGLGRRLGAGQCAGKVGVWRKRVGVAGGLAG